MGSVLKLRPLRTRCYWLIPAGVIAAMLAPLLFTDRTFASDWGNHLWLIWVQGQSIQSLGEPSYFLQSSLGAFYPYFAFYGGSMYTALGVASSLASPTAAVAFAYACALAASYLGWTWLAMQAGIRGWRAQLPGCIAVTAPFAVTNLYGRGDIPEAIATATIPLIAASGLSLIRKPHVRLRDATLFVVALATLTGTHTLTLVWGTTFLLLCAALLLASNWRAAVEKLGRCLTLLGLSILGVCLNAWILMPLVLYHTRLAEGDPDAIGQTAYTDPQQLFSILRNASNPAPITGDLNTQLPVLALLWALICGAAFWRFLSPVSKRLALGLLGIGGGFLLLILSPSLIEQLPTIFRYIQFPYRIVTYASLCVVGLVTLALAAMQRDSAASRLPVLALAAIALFSVGLAIDQNFKVRSWLTGRDEALQSAGHPPPTWYAPLQFADAAAPIVEPTLSPPVHLPVESSIRDSYSVTYQPGPAGTVATNILTGTYLVDVVGAKPVGRTPEGMMVVQLAASRAHPRHIEVTAKQETGVAIGRWLTVISLVVAVLAAATYAAMRRRSKP